MVAIILEMQGKPAEAQRVYEQVVAAHPRAAVAANNLAWMHAERGVDLDLALQLAQAAKQELPNAPEVNDTLGWIYYRKDLATLAVPALESAVHADPKNASFSYHLGLAYGKTRDVARAARAFDEAVKLKPDFREAIDARAALKTQK